MAGYVGRDVLLEWGGIAIPGVREKALSLNGEAIDVTSDEDGGVRTLLSNISAEDMVDVSLSGVTKSGALKHDWFNGQRTKTLTLEYPDGSVITGSFYMDTFSETEPYKDASTFEATLKSSGPVSFLPYS